MPLSCPAIPAFLLNRGCPTFHFQAIKLILHVAPNAGLTSTHSDNDWLPPTSAVISYKPPPFVPRREIPMGANSDQPVTGKRARNDDAQRGGRKAQRKRAALACDECRARKRRCDGGIPACGGCTRRLSTCVYSSEVEARAWQNR